MKMQTHAKKQTVLLAAGILALSFLVTGCFKTRADIEREREEKEMQQTLHKNVYDATETAQATQSQIGRLNGRLEEMEHFRRKEAEDQRKSMNVLGEKVTQLEERLAKSDALQSEMIEEMKKMKTENIRLMTESSGPAPGRSKKKSAEKSSLKLGIDAFNQKKFDEAAEHLQKAVDAGPKSKDFVKANYYLGQAQFALKNFAEAIIAYSVVFENDTKDPLWKSSTLRIAESFQKLGKKKDAKPFAQALVEKFPESTEAKQAKKFL